MKPEYMVWDTGRNDMTATCVMEHRAESAPKLRAWIVHHQRNTVARILKVICEKEGWCLKCHWDHHDCPHCGGAGVHRTIMRSGE